MALRMKSECSVILIFRNAKRCCVVSAVQNTPGATLLLDASSALFLCRLLSSAQECGNCRVEHREILVLLRILWIF